jgi:WD40 repeat protein
MVSSAVRAQVTPSIVWQSKATNGYISNPVAISPDGSVAATLGTNNSVQIWNVSNGVPLIALSGHGMWIGDLAFSPDGAFLASGSGDSSVRVWRTADWSFAYSVPSASQGPPVAFSPDSGTLAVGSGTTIQLRRATNGALIHSWTATTGEMKALAFSPDGNKLASGAGIRGFDTALKIWEVPNGTLLRSVPTAQTYGIGRVVFSPDGLQVLAGSEYLYSGPMQSWRVSDGALLRTFPLAAYSMVFSADGAVLAAVGTNIVFFRAADGTLIQEYSDGFASFTQGEKGIALAPSGCFIRSRGLGEVLAGRVPVLVSMPSIQAGQMIIRWVGGTGRYQLQRVSAIGSGWQDEGGIVTTNSVTVTPSTPSGFYRVIALPQ